jgi:hypothetical protein
MPLGTPYSDFSARVPPLRTIGGRVVSIEGHHLIMWLLLERPGADVCLKDPGFAVDLMCRGNIADFVAIYLGHAAWRDVAGRAISIEGDHEIAKQLPGWLRLDKVPGRDFPVVRPAA